MKKIFCITAESGRVYTSFTSLKKELRDFCMIDGEILENIDLRASQPTLFAHFLKNKYPNSEQIDTFYRMITDDTADVYSLIGNYAGISREESKIEFLKFLYKDPKGNSLYQSIIKEKLPEVHKIILQEKKLSQNIAVDLQKIEADIFVGSTHDFIQKGCLTLHDGIYFKWKLKKDIFGRIEENLLKKGIHKYKLKYNNHIS